MNTFLALHVWLLSGNCKVNLLAWHCALCFHKLAASHVTMAWAYKKGSQMSSYLRMTAPFSHPLPNVHRPPLPLGRVHVLTPALCMYTAEVYHISTSPHAIQVEAT